MSTIFAILILGALAYTQREFLLGFLARDPIPAMIAFAATVTIGLFLGWITVVVGSVVLGYLYARGQAL